MMRKGADGRFFVVSAEPYNAELREGKTHAHTMDPRTGFNCQFSSPVESAAHADSCEISYPCYPVPSVVKKQFLF